MYETNVVRCLRDAAEHATWYLDRVIADPSRGTHVQTEAARVALEAYHRYETLIARTAAGEEVAR